MKDPLTAAELLEDILRKADHYEIVRNTFERIIGNIHAKFCPAQRMISPHPQQKWLIVNFYIPVQVVMKDVNGTPEQVLEWARTGLREDEQITIDRHPAALEDCFSIQHTFKDPIIFDDYMEMNNKYALKIMEAQRRHQTSGVAT